MDRREEPPGLERVGEPALTYKFPGKVGKASDEHERAFICAACSDQAVAHPCEDERTAVAGPPLGKRAQVERRRRLCPGLDREPRPRPTTSAAHVHVT